MIKGIQAETAEAVGWIDRAVDRGVDPRLLREDPDLDGLRGHPGFEQLVGEARSGS